MNLQNDNARGQAGVVGKAQINQSGFCYPNVNLVKGRVLGALLRGENLTHLDCWCRFGSSRLAHHVYILRGIGWGVQMVESTVTTSDGGRPATIGIYSLPPNSLQRLAKLGRGTPRSASA